MVFLYHMPDLSPITSSHFISKSGIFVDLFFILSGFVIYHTYHDKAFNRSTSWTFIKKRFKRLLPLHFYTLGILLGLELIKYVSYNYFPFSEPPFSSNNWNSFWPQLTLLNATPFFVDFSWNGPNWSISAEVFAYLTFVLTSILSLRKKRFSFLISLAIVLIGYTFYFSKYDTFDLTVDFNYSFIRGLIGFNLGICIYIMTKQCQPFFNRISSISSSILELIAIISVVVLVSSINPLVKDNFYLLDIAFALIIFIFSFEGGLLSKLFLRSGFQSIGAWSYSIYLNHFFLIAIYQMVAIKLLKLEGTSLLIAEVVLTILLLLYSKLTYMFIEKRFYKKLKN